MSPMPCAESSDAETRAPARVATAYERLTRGVGVSLSVIDVRSS